MEDIFDENKASEYSEKFDEDIVEEDIPQASSASGSGALKTKGTKPIIESESIVDEVSGHLSKSDGADVEDSIIDDVVVSNAELESKADVSEILEDSNMIRDPFDSNPKLTEA